MVTVDFFIPALNCDGCLQVTRTSLIYVTLTAVFRVGSESPPARLPIWKLKNALKKILRDNKQVRFQNCNLLAVDRYSVGTDIDKNGVSVCMRFKPSPDKYDLMDVSLDQLHKALAFSRYLRVLLHKK